MLILRTLSRWFPGLRPLFAGIGYLLLLIGGVVWFVCFPLTAYTLYTAHEFPLDYFGISVWLGFPLDFFLPRELWPALVPGCLAFTLFGLVTIYRYFRNLRRLRRA